MPVRAVRKPGAGRGHKGKIKGYKAFGNHVFKSKKAARAQNVAAHLAAGGKVRSGKNKGKSRWGKIC